MGSPLLLEPFWLKENGECVRSLMNLFLPKTVNVKYGCTAVVSCITLLYNLLLKLAYHLTRVK